MPKENESTKLPDNRPEGRPRKFQSPKQLENLIDQYFSTCYQTQEITDQEGNKVEIKQLIRPFTITGLALSLGTTRRTLLEYATKYEPAYIPPIKKALEMCHNYAEEQLYTGKQVAGAIFNLKNNYGWVDKTEVNTTVTMKQLTDDELERKLAEKLNKLGITDITELAQIADIEG